MIIWDEKNKEHFIRIKGKEKTRIKANNFQIIGSNEQIETAIKVAVNAKVSDENYHTYIHIISKDPLNYVIWLGPVDWEPNENWWET